MIELKVDNLRKVTGQQREVELMGIVMASMESFRNTKVIRFLDMAKEALDLLHESAHNN